MRVHFFGPAPRVEVTPEMSVEQCFVNVGGNTGNLMFINALVRQIAHTEATFGYKIDPADIDENVGLVVIPAANWLQPGTDLTGWYRALRPTKVPLLLIGIGAQALRYSDTPALPSGTISFLKMVSERSKTIGTRGDFTTKVLHNNGFKNAVTTGCPSLYMHCTPSFPEVKDAKKIDNSLLVLQGTRHYIQKDITKYNSGRPQIERRLFLYARDKPVRYVFQSEREELHLALRRPVDAYPDPESLQLVLDFYDVKSIEELNEFFSRSRVFFDISEWMAFLRSMDFVCGSRLHGCIAGMLAGTRSFLLTHDTRTGEMADFAGLPSMPANEFVAAVEQDGLETVINRVNELKNYENFYKKYKINYAGFQDFLEHNQVGHNLRS